MRATKHSTLGQGIRNQSFYLNKKAISDQDSKLLIMLGLEIVSDSWTLSQKTNIFITSTRRSMTNLLHQGLIKEVGSIIGVAGKRVTQFALKNTPDSEIFKRREEIENKKYQDTCELEELKSKMTANDYLNKMLKSEINNK